MLNFLTHLHLLELNEKVISDYEKVYEENNNSILKFEEPITDDIKIIPFKEPNLVQLEALEELKKSRDQFNKDKGLVVMATGLGKTILAALLVSATLINTFVWIKSLEALVSK